MANPGRKYLLKILSGPNQGAEAPVGAGDLTLGSADTADIILGDSQVAPQQLQFTFSGESISVTALAPGVYLQGKPLKPKSSPALVLPYQFITVGGGTHIVLGPAAGNWPTLSAADAPALEKEAPAPAKQAASPTASASGAGTPTAAADARAKSGAAAAATPSGADTSAKPGTSPAGASTAAKGSKDSAATASPGSSPAASASVAASAASPKGTTTSSATTSASPSAAAPAAKPGTAAPGSAPADKLPPPRYKVLAYALVGLAVLSLLALYLFQNFVQPPPPSMAPLTSEQLKVLLTNKIKDLQLAGLIKVELVEPPPPSPSLPGLAPAAASPPSPADAAAGEGSVRVVGYVATDAERTALFNALAPSLGRAARFEVYSQENILSQSADILRQLVLPLKLSVTGPGVIKAEGYIVSRASWQKAIVFLKRDIRGLVEIQENIVAAPELVTEIKKILTDARIENEVRVEATLRQMTALGTLPENRAQAWLAAKKSILEKTAGLVPLVDQVRLVSTAGGTGPGRSNPLDLEIQSVSEAPAFVALKNGQTYFPGAVLPNGYVLVAVQPRRLILQKETERISLNLDDMTWQQQNP